MRTLHLLTIAYLFCASLQECPPAILQVYSQITDNLWGVQALRKNLYAALFESRSSISTMDTYFATTAIIDGLRRRHIDLYPILATLPELRTFNTSQQVVRIMQIISGQREFSCAAEEVSNAFKEFKIESTANLTIGLEKVQTVTEGEPLRNILELLRSHIKVCNPSQPLVGAILVNVPIRTSVAQASLELSNYLRDSDLDDKSWEPSLRNTPLGNENLISWLKVVVKKLAGFTNNATTVEKLADGILELNFDEQQTAEWPQTNEETNRWSRSATEGVDPNVNALAYAIARFATSLMRQNTNSQNCQVIMASAKPEGFSLAHNMIHNINDKMAKPNAVSASASLDPNRQVQIAVAMTRSNSANNESNESISEEGGQ